MYVLARRSKDFGLFTSPLTKVEGMASTEAPSMMTKCRRVLALDASSKLVVRGCECMLIWN